MRDKILKKKEFALSEFFSVVFLVSILLISAFPVSASNVTRSFSSTSPATCSALDVTLSVNVTGNDSFYIIDEIFPSGWDILSAGTGNSSDPGHIKWVVTNNATSTQYQYTLNATCTATGEYNFSGEYGFNNLTLNNISGEFSVTVTDYEAPVITLIGNSTINLQYNTTYTDAGATAIDNVDGNLTSSIITVNNVDVNTVGTYNVTYNVVDSSGNNATEVVRTVNVVDVSIPVITLIGNSTVSVEYNTTYTDAGATAFDNADGDLTANITTVNNVDVNTVGTYNVTYNVIDNSGNNAVEVVRTVNVVDTVIPVITLIGSSLVNVSFGSTYTDAGATATDNVDGNLTSSIITSGSVNTTLVGTYNVTYNVVDSSGNNATEVIRTVSVDPLICETTADTDVSYIISTSELLVHIGKWNTGNVSNGEILKAINYWNIGLGC